MIFATVFLNLTFLVVDQKDRPGLSRVAESLLYRIIHMYSDEYFLKIIHFEEKIQDSGLAQQSENNYEFMIDKYF